MYAVIFEKEQFLTRERKDEYLEHMKQFESDHPLYIPYNRIESDDGLKVLTVNYSEVMPHQLDAWFHAQMNSLDTALTSPGAIKRVSSNLGYDPSLTDVEEDY